MQVEEFPKIIDTFLQAVKNYNLTFSDIIQAASVAHIDAVDNLHRTNVTIDSKMISSIDGTFLKEGDRILIKDQTDSRQNGIYETVSIPSSDKLTLQKIDQELTNSIAYVVNKGENNNNSIWITKIDTFHPENINFVPLTSFSKQDNTLPAPIQQTIYTYDPSHDTLTPLTAFNSILATTEDAYIYGTTHTKQLKLQEISLATSRFKLYPDREQNAILFKSEVYPVNFVVGNVSKLPALSINDSTVSISNDFQSLGNSRFLGDVNISGSINLEGDLNLNQGKFSTSSMHINTDTSYITTHDLSDYGNLTLMGNTSSKTGPHITTFSYADEHPILNLCSWSHDDVSVNFDCHYDGATCTPSHPTAAQLRKHRDQLQFNYYNSAYSAFLSAFTIDLTNGTVLYSTPNTVFSNTDGTLGSVKLLPSYESNESSIAFYKSSVLQYDLPDDFWKISLDKTVDALSIVHGQDSTSMIFRSDGTVQFDKQVHFKTTTSMNEELSVQKNVTVGELLKTDTFHVESDVNVSNDGSAAAVINGGVQIGKSLIVNDQIVSTRILLSAKRSRIVFNASEHAPPLLNENSAGTRFILSKNLTPVTTNAAIGTEGNGSIWYSIPGNLENYAHVWYAGATKIMTLDGTGNLSLSGNGSLVSFSGLSNIHGFALSGINESDAAFIRYGKNWNLGRTSQGDFELKKVSADSTIQSVLKVTEADLSCYMYGGLTVRGSVETSSSISCSYLNVTDKVVISRQGISHLGKQVLTFQSPSSDLSLSTQDDTPLDINGQKTISSFIRTSDTHVNRHNNGTFTIWKGHEQLLHLNEQNAHFIQGNVIVGKGNLDISAGDLNISRGKLVAESLLINKGLRIGKSPIDGQETVDPLEDYPGAHVILQEEGTKLEIVTTNGNNVVHSNHTMQISSDQDIILQAGGSLQWLSKRTNINNVSMEGTVTTKSDYISRITSREGRLQSVSHSETLTNDGDTPVWYYIGRLNTTISSRGVDECGHMEMSLCAIPLTSGRAAEVRFSAEVNPYGEVFPSHEFVHSDHSNAHIHLYRNDDSGDFYKGDIHVFVQIESKTVVQTNIKTYLTGKTVDIVKEGSNDNPNGNFSMFKAGVWSKLYTTKRESSILHSVGRLICNGQLDVSKESTFNQGVFVKALMQIDDSLYVEKGIHCNNLFVKGESVPTISLDLDRVTLHKNLVPALGNIQIGSVDSAFEHLYVKNITNDDLICRTISMPTTDGKITTNEISTITMRSEDAEISSLQVKGNTFLHNIYIDGNVSGNFDMNIVGGGTFGNIETRTLDVTEGMNVQGSLVLSEKDTISPFAKVTWRSGQVILESDKFTVQNQQGTTNVLASGHVTSTGHILLAPNEDPLVVLTQTGDVVIHHPEVTHREISRFLVNSEETVFSRNVKINALNVDNDCVLHGGKITLGENTSSIQRSVDGLVFSIGDYSFTFDTNGILKSAGDMICLGQGSFKNVTSSGITAEKLDITDPDGNQKVHLSIDESGSMVFKSLGGDLPFRFVGSAGSAVAFENGISAKDGLIVGKGSESSKGIYIHTDGLGKNGSITFVNDTLNKAVLSLASSNESSSALKPYALNMANDGGDVVINAAGRRGITVMGVSGNLSCNGAVIVESALDFESTGVFDKSSAALRTNGGGSFAGHVLSEKGMIIGNQFHVKFGVSDALQKDYTLTLPKDYPEKDGSILCSDTLGNLYWSPFPEPSSTNEDSEIVVPADYTFPSVIKGNVTSDADFGVNSSFLQVHQSTYKGTKRVSLMGLNPQWNAIHVQQPILDMSEGYVDETDTFVVSTLYIEGAPKSKFAKDSYAIDVKSGKLLLEDQHDSVTINDAAVVIKGGLSVAKMIRCGSELWTDGIKIGKEGTLQKKTITGKYVIGASNEKSITVPITYDGGMMPDVNYVIVGNVVSAQDNGAVYVCSFTALTMEGCKVNVCIVNGDRWDDITVAIHYYVVAK